MKKYINSKSIKEKIEDMQLFISSNGTCKVIISVLKELEEIEKEDILNFVKGQVRGDWGKGSFDFVASEGNDYSLIFCKNDSDLCVKYIYDDLYKLLLEKYKNATEKECYELELLDEEPGIKDNKIGGIPYLPLGESYPKDKDGNMMPLLLQINLKSIELENFPKQGILQIFLSSSYLYQEQEGYVVKYFPDNLEYQKDGFPDLNLNDFIVKQSYKLKLKKVKCHMPQDDYRAGDVLRAMGNDIIYNVLHINENSTCDFDKVFGNKIIDELYSYNEEFGMYRPLVCIGGYASFIQKDPRIYSNSDKSECIFCLDSLYDTGIFGGDEMVYALISLEDLRNNRFENTYVDWDCG